MNRRSIGIAAGDGVCIVKRNDTVLLCIDPNHVGNHVSIGPATATTVFILTGGRTAGRNIHNIPRLGPQQ